MDEICDKCGCIVVVTGVSYDNDTNTYQPVFSQCECDILKHYEGWLQEEYDNIFDLPF